MREMTLGDRLKQADWLLLGLGVLLAFAGVMGVQTAEDGRVTYGSIQMRWAIIGVTVCLLMLAVPYRFVVQWRYLWYVGAVILLLAVLVVGRGKSAGRWIQLGAFRMQPSEIMKLILVITLAGYIRYERRHRTFRGLFTPFAITLIPFMLIMKQPDLGTALLLLPVLFVMLYVAGANRAHLGIVASAGMVAALVMFFTPGLLNEYQKDRVRAFLMQGSDDTALLRSHNHQIEQSKMVVGTSKFIGRGTGEDTRESIRFLPERHSDFIFPVMIHAFGLSGATLLFMIYLLFIGLILRTALKVREPSGRLLAVGVATVFACQTVINLCMTLGLLPIVGMPLPFLSYGGSSLLTSFAALGLVLNVGSDHPVEFGRGDFD
ncbi:MAG: FtsW/RodA/SpoVE family cell cycle protein [Planctomycetota bacterium]|nr:FtsW/RodA/SpoVE family cell cycle protein [Planctomycetota bacterium]